MRPLDKAQGRRRGKAVRRACYPAPKGNRGRGDGATTRRSAKYEGEWVCGKNPAAATRCYAACYVGGCVTGGGGPVFDCKILIAMELNKICVEP